MTPKQMVIETHLNKLLLQARRDGYTQLDTSWRKKLNRMTLTQLKELDIVYLGKTEK